MQQLCPHFSRVAFKMSSKATRIPVDSLDLSQRRTELFKRSFRSTAARLWNSLPPNIRNSRTLDEFKQRFYAHLFLET